MDLRVGEIKEVEKHPDSDKLLISTIEFNDETRVILSGV